MPYIAEISRGNPSCFLFLIDQSGSMYNDMDLWPEDSRPKSSFLADAINKTLQKLVIKAKETYRGFTPHCSIQVLGPTFTVSVSEKTEIRVIEGKVQVFPKNSEPSMLEAGKNLLLGQPPAGSATFSQKVTNPLPAKPNEKPLPPTPLPITPKKEEFHQTRLPSDFPPDSPTNSGFD